MLFTTLTTFLFAAVNVQAYFHVGLRTQCNLACEHGPIISGLKHSCDDVLHWKKEVKDNFGWTTEGMAWDVALKDYFSDKNHPIPETKTIPFQHMCGDRRLWLTIPDDVSHGAFFVFDKEDVNGYGDGALGTCTWHTEVEQCSQKFPKKDYAMYAFCHIDGYEC